MKREALFALLLICLLPLGCRRAATAQKPAQAAQPQPSVCAAENVSRAALLRSAASPTPPASPAQR